MTVTPQIPWRSTGNTDEASFARAIARSVVAAPSPMAAEASAIYRILAAANLSRLAAAMAYHETKNATWAGAIPPANRNPWAISLGMAGGVHTWAHYDSFALAASDWVHRLTTPGNPYSRAQTLRDFLMIYAPPSDGNDVARYLQVVCDQINALPPIGEETPVPTPDTYTFGMPPWPKGFDRHVVKKPPSGQGWDALGDRRAVMCSTFWHITDGYDNRDSVAALFGPGGGRYTDALTEAVIGRDGLGYLMNDPWSDDPNEGSGRTPWASGPATDLKGPGVPFVQALGANAVNKRGFSIEHCNKEGQAFTDIQLEMSAKVTAVAITRMKIPWDKWPYNPNVNGLYVAMRHNFIAPKSCPGYVWDPTFHSHHIERVRAEAKTLQTGSNIPPGPTPPPPPPPPPPAWPFAFTKEQVAGFWGKLRRYLPDATTKDYAFDENGSIASMWLARGAKEGKFPGALEWYEQPAGTYWATFGTPGNVDWVLYLPSITARADFRWVDKRDIPA